MPLCAIRRRAPILGRLILAFHVARRSSEPQRRYYDRRGDLILHLGRSGIRENSDVSQDGWFSEFLRIPLHCLAVLHTAIE